MRHSWYSSWKPPLWHQKVGQLLSFPRIFRARLPYSTANLSIFSQEKMLEVSNWEVLAKSPLGMADVVSACELLAGDTRHTPIWLHWLKLIQVFVEAVPIETSKAACNYSPEIRDSPEIWLDSREVGHRSGVAQVKNGAKDCYCSMLAKADNIIRCRKVPSVSS